MAQMELPAEMVGMGKILPAAVLLRFCGLLLWDDLIDVSRHRHRRTNKQSDMTNS